MTFEIKTLNDYKVLLLGIGLGAGVIYGRMKKRQERLAERFTDDCNLRTDLLNWITTEGIFLEADEFFEQYQEKAAFINLVT